VSTNATTVRLYWQQIKKYKVSFFAMLFGIPISALLIDTAIPYFLSQAVGTLASGDSSSLWHFITLASCAAVVGVVFNFVGFQSAIYHEGHVRHDLTISTAEQLLQKDQNFYSNQKIGALTGYFISFVASHVDLQDLVIIRTISFILSVGSGVAIIFFHAPLLGGIILALIIGLLIQIRVSMKIRMPYRLERKRLVGEVNGAAADAITNSLTVKTFANEKAEQTTLSKLTEKYRNVYQKDFRIMSFEGSLRILIMSAVQIIAIIVIAILLTNGEIELGIAIFAIAYLQRIASQLFGLGDIINGYDRIFLAAAPMTEILLQNNDINDVPNAQELLVTSGAIDFNNVDYAYSDSTDINVLESLSLHIPKGQKVGLVGTSGAGKTTLTKLLLRFDDSTAGTITIDGQPIRDITQQSLRKNIAYVPQEPTLFHRSLRENIAYGRLNASDNEIREAASKAHALSFIEKLPEGLDTIVGERGIKLSGGQRQRIAIARAILKDAPILILDEATSALDSESEKLIQQALEKLMQGRTSIVIAHRLSTIAKLDRVIVMDKGKIVEDGTHLQLIKQGGIYAMLWAHQSGGFIEE
jgi:ATP-binding cassette subfamily B protein